MTDYKQIAIELWELLDDIDTAEDLFRPEITPHFKYVNKKHRERFQHITSDGFDLFGPDGEKLTEGPTNTQNYNM